MRNNKTNAALYIITGFRDALSIMAKDGDFHAKVMLHHFFENDSKTKFEAVKRTVQCALIEKALAAAKEGQNEV